MWLPQSWTSSVAEQVLVYEECSDFELLKAVFVVKVKLVVVVHGSSEAVQCSSLASLQA